MPLAVGADVRMICRPVQPVRIGCKRRRSPIGPPKAVRMVNTWPRPIRAVMPGVICSAALGEDRGREPCLRVAPAVLLGKDVDQQAPQLADLLLEKLQAIAGRIV